MRSSVLAIGGLGLDAYRTRVANFLTAEDGRVCLIEVRLFNSAGFTVGRNEWRPGEDEDLDGIAEQIARYIIGHESADATILVRRDGSGRVQGAESLALEAQEYSTVARGHRKRKVKTQRESAAKPELLTIKELAAYLHAHRMTIYRLLSKGQLPGFRVGHIWRFRREEIDRWMRRKSEE